MYVVWAPPSTCFNPQSHAFTTIFGSCNPDFGCPEPTGLKRKTIIPARDPKQCGGVKGYCSIICMMMSMMMMRRRRMMMKKTMMIMRVRLRMRMVMMMMMMMMRRRRRRRRERSWSGCGGGGGRWWWGGGGGCWEGRPIPRPGNTLCACAVEMHMDIWQEPLRVEIYRKSAGLVRACAVEAHMDIWEEPFCEEIYRKNAGCQFWARYFVLACAAETHMDIRQFRGKMPDAYENTSIKHRALTVAVRTPSVWSRCLVNFVLMKPNSPHGGFPKYGHPQIIHLRFGFSAK